jgi:type II secretory pathway component GspD/PulD (secretin)
MDARPRQVLVEAVILQVQLTDTTSLGVNFNALAGLDFRDLTTTSATPVTNPTTNANASSTTVAKNFTDWAHINTQTGVVPGQGLNIGVLTNNVAVFINALELVTDTVILANPKVLALNKQRANVIIGQRVPFVTTTNTETTAVQTVSFLDVGTELIFRPFISDDGYVRLEIHPKVSSYVQYGTTSAPLPGEKTTECTANVMVKDGHTIVIGGLFDENTSVTRSQVPGLGNIPILGWLFRSNGDSTIRSEVIVLLTPHIIDNDDAANELGKAAWDDAKRRLLGLREGFACFSGERLTSFHMQEADKAWQRFQETRSPKDLDQAWWNVQLALNISPNDLKGIRLKDEILSEKRGEPVEPPNWTIWDSINDRLRDMDEAKRQDAEEKANNAPAPAAPAAPKAEEPKHE